MNRNKLLSLSQGDLVDSTDSTEYKASSNCYSLQELNSSGHKLPLVIRIDDGFYGKTDWTTISSNEVIFLHRLELRKRALATAEDGTRYSFPLDYPLLFIPTQLQTPNSATKSSKSGKKKSELPVYNNEVENGPMSLKEIIANYQLPINVVIDDAYVTFHSSNHDQDTVHFGQLTFTHVYDEKYFVGNEIRNGNPSHQVTLLPTFLRVKVRLVQGFAQKNQKLSWKSAVSEWTSRTSQINYDAISPPSDVAEFKSDVVAKVAKTPAKLDAIEPNTYIKLTFLPVYTDHTYEELPIVSHIHLPEPGVSTFKLHSESVSRPAVLASEPSKTDTGIYNEVESPTTETPSFGNIASILESSYQQHKPSFPGKRLEPRSYSPVPSPPSTLSIVTEPAPFLPKSISRAPMPLPKQSGNTETPYKSDVPFVNPPRNPYDGFATVTQATLDRSRLHSYGDKESAKAIRDEQRREHPVVPLPPQLPSIDLQKVLKPVNKSVKSSADLESKSTFLDAETPKAEDRTVPRKPKQHKPRSKTDVSLSTSAFRSLQQETTQQDITASEPRCEEPEWKPPLPKYKIPPVKSKKAPFPKARISLTENDHDVADPKTSSLDYDELLCTESDIKIPQKVKLPPPLPHTESKSSLPDKEVCRAESPKTPLQMPKVRQEEYECPSRDSKSSLSGNEQNAPKTPQLNYEKLSTKGRADAIESIPAIPEQLDKLSCFQLADCLKLLNMESYITTFIANQIDGKLLLELDENILTSDLQVSKLHAKKLLMFAHRGWRP